MNESSKFKAVLWDFGGVITTSPFEAFNRYENAQSLPVDFIRSVNASNPETNAWAQLESNEISLDTFNHAFAAESKSKGHEIPGRDVLALLSGDIRPEMVSALKIIKATMKIACITNNVKKTGSGPGMAGSAEKAEEIASIFALFDTVIESSKAGVRKPNPRIYEIACEAIGIKPDQAIFLDDLGINLKPAKAMGMTTIKVLDAKQALTELSALLGIDLLQTTHTTP